MSIETEVPVETWEEKLADPKIAAALVRMLNRSEELEQATATLAQASKAIPDLAAMATDMFDEGSQRARESGIDLEARFQSLVRLFVKATDPKTVTAVERLIDRLPQLEEASRLLDELPNLIAMVVDVLDDFAKSSRNEGVDIEKSLTQGLRAAFWLSSRVTEKELDRLGILLRSDVLDTHALEVLSHAATSLVSCQEESCTAGGPERVGMVGAIRALQNPDIQKTIGFATRFAQCFGTRIGTTSHPPDASNLSNEGRSA